MNAVLAGIDGYRGGWVAAIQEGGRTRLLRMRRLAELQADRAVVDIPVGLPTAGPRPCDLAARRLLGRPRCSSVFPAPTRQLLAAAQPRCSRQLFNILDKIREADELIAPSMQMTWWEGHPEVCFALMEGGRGLAEPKRTPAGRARRLALLARRFADLPERLDGDEIDAYALLWTARRIAAGEAISLPADPQLDPRGLLMRIVA